MKIEQVKNSPDIDVNKIQKTYDSLMAVFKKQKLNVKEILLVLGNLTYSLGASIGGYKDKGPSNPELEKKYLLKPTIDVVLMLSGLNFCSFVGDLDKSIDQIKEELIEKKNSQEKKSE